MADGGRITIRTENVGIEAERPGGAKPGRYVKVIVKDDGAGMHEEVMAKAFDPFFTTKEVGGGSGLGLSQVYGFAKSLGGHVEIESEIGLGTTVSLLLPKSAEPLPPRISENVLPLRRARGTETLLAVEDDEEVLELTVVALKDLGYTVLTATMPATRWKS